MPHQTIGHNLPRIDAAGKVTGQTLYPGDIVYPDMLHMATLFSDRPHARILNIDTSAAAAADVSMFRMRAWGRSENRVAMCSMSG